MREGKDNIMRESVIWEKHTDFIKERQEVLVWEFDIAELKRAYEVEVYSLPVEIELFRALKKISSSKNRLVRERSFTLFTGDCGPGCELFAVGITAKTSSKVTDIITLCFEGIRGYVTMEYGEIPSAPLIPCYRYEHGSLFEYTAEYFNAGKLRPDDAVISGLKVNYRMYESADALGVKEIYQEM